MNYFWSPTCTTCNCEVKLCHARDRERERGRVCKRHAYREIGIDMPVRAKRSTST